MTTKPTEIEGTWEEIITHAAEFAGHQVRVTILSDRPQSKSLEKPPLFRPASGRSLLRHAGTWAGNDFEDCLKSVYENRSAIAL